MPRPKGMAVRQGTHAAFHRVDCHINFTQLNAVSHMLNLKILA